jgi:membrane protein implicated in regulation of membrane protease activity
LHTGTFYLAGVAAAALLTTLLGFWVHDEWLIVVFLLLSIVLITLVIVSRRRLPRGKALADFDIGQIVTVDSVAPGNRVTVTYRGTRWQATMDGGAVPEPGDIAVITRKTDKLLHLALPSKGGKT